jgi:hypothetical protein
VKKIILLVALLLAFSIPVMAVDMDVWLSSNTATADTTVPLCAQYLVGTSTVTARGVIHSVVVSSPSAGGVTLYNSSWTATGVQNIGPDNTGSTVAPYNYDVVFTNGLMYTKTGTANVQILYQCY